jgi:hypothetical protein
MRTAVVAGEYGVAGGKQRDLFAAKLGDDLAVTAQSFERHGGNPTHGIPSGNGNSRPSDLASNRYLISPPAGIICQGINFPIILTESASCTTVQYDVRA